VSAVAREGWILIGFLALALAGIAVSAAGWILFVRDRQYRRATRPDEGYRAGVR
jgi:hypothetical protein